MFALVGNFRKLLTSINHRCCSIGTSCDFFIPAMAQYIVVMCRSSGLINCLILC